MSASGALARGRAAAAALMRDTCKVTSTAPGAWNDTTGTYGAPTVTTVYQGQCRLRRPAAAPQTTDAGETAWAVDVLVLSLPVIGSEDVADGHTVEILTCESDPAAVGLLLEVQSGHWQSQSTARRVPVKVVTRDA